MSPNRPAASFHAVMLAGGGGTRFWPWSRARRPKQFLPLAGGSEALVAATWRRLLGLAPPERIWVVAPRDLAARVRRALPGLERGHLLLEPAPRDTAPAVTLACAAVAKAESPSAVVAIFPSDHVIDDEAEFRRTVATARRQALEGALVCLGVRPDRPATGFGYIRCVKAPSRGRPVGVERFVEKPDAARARRFLRSGRYLWNAGMFVWQAGRFLEEVGRTAPRVLRAVEGYLAGRPGAWLRADRISVDYAVLEKARGLEVVPLEAGWDDVGSWNAAARLREARGAEGPISSSPVLVDSEGSAVFGDGRRLVAVVGVPGTVVVDSGDAVLVVARDRAEDVRKVVEELRSRDRRDLL